ncbi:hypothetical protein, partial [Burkholderia cepacia]|uniref:hypothetical protein n=1 Tax=Burkholderia cepacia TaxID=292 RepID=UPI001E45D590
WNSIHPCLRFSILRNVGFHFFRPASDEHGTLAGSHYRTVLLNDDATMQASVGNPVNMGAATKGE